MPLPKLKIAPRSARNYLFFALVLFCIPSLLTFYFPSHKGRLLVASGASEDAVFAKTVLYMTMHNAYGASGFVMNRPLQGAALHQAQRRFPRMSQFRYGGPIKEPYRHYWLVPLVDRPDGFQIVSPEQLQKELPEQYREITHNDDIAQKIIVFQGYAGWAPMQLNREMYYGGWDVVAYDRGLVFDTSLDDIWSKALSRVLAEKKVSNSAI